MGFDVVKCFGWLKLVMYGDDERMRNGGFVENCVDKLLKFVCLVFEVSG